MMRQMTTAKIFWRYLFYSLILSLGVSWCVSGYTQDTEELSKADYAQITKLILNFARLSEWPNEALQSKDEKFRIGVLGSDLFAKNLENNLKSKTLFEREIQVVSYSTSDEYSQSHLLYISPSEERNLGDILAALNGKTVMTVSDISNFGEYGGMFGFTYQRSPEPRTNDLILKFQINADVAKAAGIKVSLALSKLGKIVSTKGAPKESESKLIRVAIFQPWDFPSPVEGVGEGLYRSIRSEKNLKITYTTEPDLANQLGVEHLNIEPSRRNKLWKQVSKRQHSEPNVNEILALTEELDIDLVFLYSSPMVFPYDVTTRVFLIDLQSKEIHKTHKFFPVEATHNYSFQANEMGREFLRDYLASAKSQEVATVELSEQIIENEESTSEQEVLFDSGRIQIAVLPPWEFAADRQMAKQVKEGVYDALALNKKLRISHSFDEKLAKEVGADLLNIGSKNSSSLWVERGTSVHSEPNITAVKSLLKGKNVRAVAMYSLPQQPYDQGHRVFIIDLDTERVFQSRDYPAEYPASVKVSRQTDTLIHDYLATFKKPPIRVAVFPPWVFQHPYRNHVKKEFFKSLSSIGKFQVAYTSDTRFARNIGAKVLDNAAQNYMEIWKPGGRGTHTDLNLSVLQNLASELDVNAVITYSMPDAVWSVGFKVFIFDLKTKRLHQGFRYIQSLQTAEEAGELAKNTFLDYLDSLDNNAEIVGLPDDRQTKSEVLPTIQENSQFRARGSQSYRIAVLPPRVFQSRFKRDVEENFLNSLTSYKALEIAYAYDANFAEQTGAKRLDDKLLDSNKIWQQGGRATHVNLDLDTLKDVYYELDARAIVTYSLPDQTWAVGVKVYLLDLETGKLYQELGNSSFHYLPDEAREITANVVQDFVNNLQLSEGPQ